MQWSYIFSYEILLVCGNWYVHGNFLYMNMILHLWNFCILNTLLKRCTMIFYMKSHFFRSLLRLWNDLSPVERSFVHRISSCVNRSIPSALQMKGGKNPIQMSGSNLCIPRNETVVSKTELQYNVLSSPSSYTHMSVRDLYISGRVRLFCCWEICGPILGINRSETHKCGNWDWGLAIPRKGTHK